jgi:hypothetical protein
MAHIGQDEDVTYSETIAMRLTILFNTLVFHSCESPFIMVSIAFMRPWSNYLTKVFTLTDISIMTNYPK